MKKKFVSESEEPEGYEQFLKELKERIQTAQVRAALSVNRELALLYWQVDKDILARQSAQGWGAKVIDQLSNDLRSAFPQMKGFSARNLKDMRAFAAAYPEETFMQQCIKSRPDSLDRDLIHPSF